MKKIAQKNSKKRTGGRNKRKKRRSREVVLGRAGIILLLVLMVIFSLRRCSQRGRVMGNLDADASKPPIDVQLLDVNQYSRPGTQVKDITGIVIHYTANPGSTAQQNRDYFNGLQDGHGDYVSSHFVVGLEGEIIQCIPTWEIAYASNERNEDTVSIECCHPDETGRFTEKTYKSMVRLTAFLCRKFGLTENQVIRHYDVTGKNCPKYFVEEEDAWLLFKEDIRTALQK